MLRVSEVPTLPHEAPVMKGCDARIDVKTQPVLLLRATKVKTVESHQNKGSTVFL